MPKEVLEKYQSTNVLGTINVIQSTGKKMVTAGNGGSIVNISRYVSLSYSFYAIMLIHLGKIMFEF